VAPRAEVSVESLLQRWAAGAHAAQEAGGQTKAHDRSTPLRRTLYVVWSLALVALTLIGPQQLLSLCVTGPAVLVWFLVWISCPPRPGHGHETTGKMPTGTGTAQG